MPAGELLDQEVAVTDLWRDLAHLTDALRVNLRIGTVWGPFGVPDNPFTPLPRLLSAAVPEDPHLAPPRPPAYAEDATDLCYVKDCGRAIALRRCSQSG